LRPQGLGMVPQQPEYTCFVCSKPVRSGSFILGEHGEIAHIVCQSRELQLASLDAVDRAGRARAWAARLVEKIRHRRPPGGRANPRLDACPLCSEPATVTDWASWVTVEDCSCRGFFIETRLFDTCASRLSPDQRGDLATVVRRHRVVGEEAWITVTDTDRTAEDRVTVRTERPDPPK
jgi:hypothetical protein